MAMVGYLVSILRPFLFVPLWIVRSILGRALDVLIGLSLLYSALHRLGAVRRFLIRWAEVELTKLSNGATVTVGDLEVDLLKGTLVATDLVIHTPKRYVFVRVPRAFNPYHLSPVFAHPEDVTSAAGRYLLSSKLIPECILRLVVSLITSFFPNECSEGDEVDDS